jgi:hypothetical protein
MAKIIIADLRTKPGASASVTEKRVRDTEGQVKTLRTLDAGSRTFGEDLRYVFGRNVAKARRDNKRIIGSTDVAVAKR